MSEYGYGEDFIGYGVELSTQTARKSKSRPRGRRGLDRDAILDTAFDMMSRVGEVDFSVRKLGSRIAARFRTAGSTELPELRQAARAAEFDK